MLLRHEVYAERALKEMDIRTEKVRTFQHLKVAARALDDGTVNIVGSRDLLVSVIHVIARPPSWHSQGSVFRRV